SLTATGEAHWATPALSSFCTRTVFVPVYATPTASPGRTHTLGGAIQLATPSLTRDPAPHSKFPEGSTFWTITCCVPGLNVSSLYAMIAFPPLSTTNS